MASTNTSRRRAGAEAARAKAAEARATARRAEQRRRLAVVGTAVGVVVIIVGVIVGVGLASRGKPATHAGTAAVPADVTHALTSVPASAFAAAGTGGAKPPTKISGSAPLTSNGKPEVLYVGAEYCPYCAAERWPMIVALSRFGTFSGLSTTHSSPQDVAPNTATFSFHGATYSSDYLSFTGKELYSNQIAGQNYAPLDKLTPTEMALFNKYSQKGGFPFVDFGNQYVLRGVQFDPQVLQGKNHSQIAATLTQPTTQIGNAIDGAANTLTATFCELTGGQPANVCTTPTISKIREQVRAGK